MHGAGFIQGSGDAARSLGAAATFPSPHEESVVALPPSAPGEQHYGHFSRFRVTPQSSSACVRQQSNPGSPLVSQSALMCDPYHFALAVRAGSPLISANYDAVRRAALLAARPKTAIGVRTVEEPAEQAFMQYSLNESALSMPTGTPTMTKSVEEMFRDSEAAGEAALFKTISMEQRAQMQRRDAAQYTPGRLAAVHGPDTSSAAAASPNDIEAILRRVVDSVVTPESGQQPGATSGSGT